MKARNILLLLINLFFILNISAQNIEFTKDAFPGNKKGLKKALKEIKKGDEYFYHNIRGLDLIALQYYLNAYKFNPNNALLNYKIGSCYINTHFKFKSLPYFLKARELNAEVSTDIIYQIGRAYHYNLEFDKAITKYKKYKETLSGEDKKALIKEVDKKIKECQTGKVLVANPVRIFIDNIGNVVNSQYEDFNPRISADEGVMLFTTRRPTTTGGKKFFVDALYFEDINIATSENGEWTIPPENPRSPLNTNDHDAVVGISPNGQKLLLYKGYINGGDLFTSELNGNEWTVPKRLNINTKYHESSASYSYDSKRIYFASDREGGYGGHDIYYTEQQADGTYGDPVNLGEPINTEYDEDCVFMHPDGKTMYFSSKGHQTMGGYDIFKTEIKGESWTVPENIGYPINSPDNDVFFVLSASGKHGYYSSAKIGGYGGQDIYRITFLGPEKPLINNNEDNLIASMDMPLSDKVIEELIHIKTNQVTIVKGTIFDNITDLPINVEGVIEITDNESQEVIYSSIPNASTSKYLFSLPSGKNYGIAFKAEGFLFHSENFDIPESTEYQEIIKDIRLQRIEVGSRIILKNIFFDFDKSTLRPESIKELTRVINLLNQYPTIKVEISGHTDSKGTEEYNVSLSQRRAQSVVNYLIDQGIAPERFVAKGYGETKPIAPNTTPDGEDFPKGRQLNRRVEFKIIAM